MKKQTQSGITLIALIITIVVLLILAAVIISLTLGERGIFNTAQQAGKNYKEASDKELADLTNLEQEMQNVINGTGNGGTTTPYALAETMGGANSPNISGFNVENTYYVTWGTTAPYQPNETSRINNAPPNGWSNYNGKEWGNIKTTGGGNDCYWVWIPRYAYKVPTKGSTAETIEIAFLKGTGSTIDDVIDETKKTEIETAGGFQTTPTPGNWVIHPVFTNAGNGGFGNLTGIWVAKFEASSSNVSETTVASDLTTTGGGNVTNLQVRVKPNVTSWREITVNNIFTVCRNLTLIGNSLENTSNLDSHMMKNTEWGAVAYLSRSVYGINSEVWNNPYYNNTTNYSPITGLCGNELNGKDNATTDINKTCKYNEIGGGNASTTGNVYGVYDMAGGAWEHVAGIYKGGISNDDRNELWDSSNSKYVDQYTETTGSQSAYYGNTNKYGDAVYETSSSGASNTGSWDSSHSHFTYSGNPVFGRGGHADYGSGAGLFGFECGTGGVGTLIGFRPVVLSSQQ